MDRQLLMSNVYLCWFHAQFCSYLQKICTFVSTAEFDILKVTVLDLEFNANFFAILKVFYVDLPGVANILAVFATSELSD